MGKKSRKKKSAGSANNANNASLTEQKTVSVVNTADAPPGGWAFELSSAEKAYKKKPNNADIVLRLLQSLTAMRRWERGNQVSREARNLMNDIDDSEKQSRFQALSNELQQITPRTPMREEDIDLCRMVWDGEQGPDTAAYIHMEYCNLNPLQVAALEGEVELFERLVSLGASIDYPPCAVENYHNIIPAHFVRTKSILPQTCSALLLVCASLAMQGLVPSKTYVPAKHRGAMKDRLDGQVEIAIQLVKLGADTSAVFDANHGAGRPMSSIYKKLGLHGKTAFELAKMSKNKELIEVMTEFHQNLDVLKKKVICRCGSRLPFAICHGAETDEERHLMREDKDGRLYFRYSPMAKCPCNHTKKTYYDCCWDDVKMRFNNDRNGELFGHHVMAMTPEIAPTIQRMLAIRQAAIEAGEDIGSAKVFPEFQGMSLSEMSKSVGSAMRMHGGTQLKEMLQGTKNREFEADVYGGCIERIENHFFWRDDHWNISKPELLLRVKEWNQALVQYCDDEGLTGQERERVFALHKASPYAPCANPMCDLLESKVKEFSLCSRCRKVSYCSRKCQAAHWKAGHKKHCFA